MVMVLEHSVDAAGQSPRVVVAQRLGQEVGGDVLVGDGSLEPLDREAADAGGRCVGRRGERAAVDHRVAHLDAGRPAVEEDAAGLELEDGEQLPAAASLSAGA